jgi:hypothetical protein
MKYKFGDKVHPIIQGRTLPNVGIVWRVFAKKCFVRWGNDFIEIEPPHSWAESELAYAMDNNDIMKDLL